MHIHLSIKFQAALFFNITKLESICFQILKVLLNPSWPLKVMEPPLSTPTHWMEWWEQSSWKGSTMPLSLRKCTHRKIGEDWTRQICHPPRGESRTRNGKWSWKFRARGAQKVRGEGSEGEKWAGGVGTRDVKKEAEHPKLLLTSFYNCCGQKTVTDGPGQPDNWPWTCPYLLPDNSTPTLESNFPSEGSPSP